MMDKKGQALSIIFFFIIVLGILIIAVLIMSLVNTILEPFRVQIQPINNESATTVGDIQTSFNSVWDWVIIFLFLFNLVLLFVSSYLVDVHPMFLVLYIITVMFLFLFGSTVLGALDSLYNPAGVFGSGNLTAGGNAITNMPLSSWILSHFTIVMLGIVILSGVIMYAKFKFGTQGGAPY